MCYYKLPIAYFLAFLYNLEEVHPTGQLAGVNQLLAFLHLAEFAAF